jgi:hypothetical protein
MAELSVPAAIAGLLIYDGDDLIFDGDDPSTYILCETAEDLQAAFAALTARVEPDRLPQEEARGSR